MYGSSIHEMVTVIGLTYWIIHTSCMHADQEANHIFQYMQKFPIELHLQMCPKLSGVMSVHYTTYM